MRRSDDDLTIEDAAIGQALEQRFVQLWKVSVERPQVAALDENIPFAPKHDRAKTVPFGLIQKVFFGWQGVCPLREHGLDRRGKPKSHRALVTLRGGFC